MESSEQVLYDRVRHLIDRYPASSQRRILIALAGTPGSGKTTISAGLKKLFNERNAEQIQVVPMDGYHYSQAVLSQLSTDPECPFRRRGAPFTFDAEAFVDLVKKLKDSTVTQINEPDKAIWVPSFDHARKDPVERDICIPSSQQIVLLEGNYLLLNDDPWRRVKDLVDETWFVSVDREKAKERLIARHIAAGIEKDIPAAAARAEGNDLLNADLINEKLLHPDVIVQS